MIWEILRTFTLSISCEYNILTSEHSHVWKGNSDADCRSITNTIMTICKCFLSSWYHSISNESAYHKNIDETSKSQRHFMKRHQMEASSALLALSAGNAPVTGEFPSLMPVTLSFDVFFDLRLNKPLSKQSWGWWFETPSCSLWRHCNVIPQLDGCDVACLLLVSYTAIYVSHQRKAICFLWIRTCFPFTPCCMPVHTWWRHQMETFSALLAICAGNSSVPGDFPAQRPVTRSFDVFFDLRLNKRLSKQSWSWWLETLSRPLWRRSNAIWI